MGVALAVPVGVGVTVAEGVGVVVGVAVVVGVGVTVTPAPGTSTARSRLVVAPKLPAVAVAVGQRAVQNGGRLPRNGSATTTENPTRPKSLPALPRWRKPWRVPPGARRPCARRGRTPRRRPPGVGQRAVYPQSGRVRVGGEDIEPGTKVSPGGRRRVLPRPSPGVGSHFAPR